MGRFSEHSRSGYRFYRSGFSSCTKAPPGTTGPDCLGRARTFRSGYRFIREISSSIRVPVGPIRFSSGSGPRLRKGCAEEKDRPGNSYSRRSRDRCRRLVENSVWGLQRGRTGLTFTFIILGHMRRSYILETYIRSGYLRFGNIRDRKTEQVMGNPTGIFRTGLPRFSFLHPLRTAPEC